MINRPALIIIVALFFLGGIFWYFASNESTNSSDLNIIYYPEDIHKDCNSDVLPVFTHDVTDLSLIIRIIPPALVNERGELKTHSFIQNSQDASVPIYAPTDGIIKWGTHVTQQNTQGKFDDSLGDEYSIFMELDCNYYIMFDHITDLTDTIKKALPEVPGSNQKLFA